MRITITLAVLASLLSACGGSDSEPDLGEASEADDFPIAGLWAYTYDGGGTDDTGMMNVTVDGLHTNYDYKGDEHAAATDPDGAGNCYEKDGPYALIEHDGNTGGPDDTYSLVLGERNGVYVYFEAAVVDDGAAINWRWIGERGVRNPVVQPVKTFPAAVGIDVTDLSPCE